MGSFTSTFYFIIRKSETTAKFAIHLLHFLRLHFKTVFHLANEQADVPWPQGTTLRGCQPPLPSDMVLTEGPALVSCEYWNVA